jgi:hypothetical protein
VQCSVSEATGGGVSTRGLGTCFFARFFLKGSGLGEDSSKFQFADKPDITQRKPVLDSIHTHFLAGYAPATIISCAL